MKNSNDKMPKAGTQQVNSQVNDLMEKSGVSDMLNRSGLSDLPQKIQQFGSSAMGRVNNLSTTQKVVGGTLLALGAGWVTMNSMKGKNILGHDRTSTSSSAQNASKSPNISPRSTH